MNARPSFYHSLLGRMIFFGAIPMAAAIGFVLLHSALTNVRRIREEKPPALIGETEHVAHTLNELHMVAKHRAQSLAAAMETGLIHEPDSTLRFAQRSLEASPRVFAIGFRFERDPMLDGAETSPPSINHDLFDDSGRFGVVVSRSIESGSFGTTAFAQVPEELLRECRRRFDTGVRGEAATVVEGPWVRDGHDVFGAMAPIVIEGHFRGVAVIEMSSLELARTIQFVDRTDPIEFFLVNAKGEILSASQDVAASARNEPAIAGQRLDGFPLGKLLMKTMRGPNEPAMCLNTREPSRGEPYFLSSVPIGMTGWTLTAALMERAALHDARAELPRHVAIAISASMFAGLFVCGLAWIASRRMREAVVATDAIASGDLTVEVPQTADRGDTGILLRSVRAMASGLADLVGRVRSASIQLNSTATEMAATVRHQEASTASFGASTSQIAAAVKQISATASELSHTMNEVREMAGETSELANKGRLGLSGMESAMGALDKGTESIASRLATINEKASRITAVVTTITKVADQTNLLSVNAAIEAEKAGEYGAGFLVVAREIRRLADQTANATLDIEQMVQQMQSAVAAGVMEMDRFAEQVRGGTHQVSVISGQMTDIIERVDRVNDRLHQVTDGMQQQAEGATQIDGAMAQLTSNASQTMQSMKEFGHAAADLQNAISNLKSSVSQFKLRAA